MGVVLRFLSLKRQDTKFLFGFCVYLSRRAAGAQRKGSYKSAHFIRCRSASPVDRSQAHCSDKKVDSYQVSVGREIFFIVIK